MNFRRLQELSTKEFYRKYRVPQGLQWIEKLEITKDWENDPEKKYSWLERSQHRRDLWMKLQQPEHAKTKAEWEKNSQIARLKNAEDARALCLKSAKTMQEGELKARNPPPLKNAQRVGKFFEMIKVSDVISIGTNVKRAQMLKLTIWPGYILTEIN